MHKIQIFIKQRYGMARLTYREFNTLRAAKAFTKRNGTQYQVVYRIEVLDA